MISSAAILITITIVIMPAVAVVQAGLRPPVLVSCILGLASYIFGLVSWLGAGWTGQDGIGRDGTARDWTGRDRFSIDFRVT